MPKFYPVSSFGNGEFIDCIPADFPDMEDLSPADRKIAQERYTMIASAVSVVDGTQQRNLMIEKSSKQFGMSKQSIRSFLCSYLVYQDVAVLFFKRICDVYDEETVAAIEQYGEDVSDFDEDEIHTFIVPEGHHWKDVRNVSENVGVAIINAFHAIEKANIDLLHGVFGDGAFAYAINSKNSVRFNAKNTVDTVFGFY